MIVRLQLRSITLPEELNITSRTTEEALEALCEALSMDLGITVKQHMLPIIIEAMHVEEDR